MASNTKRASGYIDARYLLIVFAFAGDSTITKDFAIIKTQKKRDAITSAVSTIKLI